MQLCDLAGEICDLILFFFQLESVEGLLLLLPFCELVAQLLHVFSVQLLQLRDVLDVLFRQVFDLGLELFFHELDALLTLRHFSTFLLQLRS